MPGYLQLQQRGGGGGGGGRREEGGGRRERGGKTCRMDTVSKQKWYMSTVLHVVLEHVHVLYSLQEDKDGQPNPSKRRWACAHELHIFVFLKLAIGHHV